MYEEIDDKIREELGKIPKNLPDSYEKRISDTLEHLVEYTERKRFSNSKVAAALLLLLLLGSTTAYAGVRLYQARLSSMSTEESKQLNQETQQSIADADVYSRKITMEERKRFNTLLEKYKNGTFPTGQIEKIEQPIDVDAGKLQFCIENSTFYLPKSDLTDEQVLEIIDYNFKRDYAITNQEKETPEPINENINEQTAIRLSNSFVSSIYGWKVNTSNADFDTTRNSTRTKLSCFFVKYEGVSGDYNVQTEIDANDGKINSIKVENTRKDFTDTCKFDSKNEKILNTIEVERVSDILSNKKKNVEKIDVIYRTKNKNTLYRGNLKYLISYNDGSGYTYLYNYKYDFIYEVCYVPDIKLFNEQEKRNKKIDKQMEIDYFRINLK